MPTFLPPFAGFVKLAIIATKFHSSTKLQIYEKLSDDALHRYFCKPVFQAGVLVHRVKKSLNFRNLAVKLFFVENFILILLCQFVKTH
jgi:hypothetical protein